MRPRGTAVALTVTVLLATAACGGGGTDDAGPDGGRPTGSPHASWKPPTMGPGDAAALRERVGAYVDAYFAPDADAGYALISARCKEEISEAVFAEGLKRAKDANVDGIRYELERYRVGEFSGQTAYVTYGVGDEPRFDHEWQQWSREDGEWWYDAC
ncbi:hypothetical protein GCM10010420_07240 [Streptomyces glaucosporus]|uniref:Lipoprotein n=1 Tax=Streptomyces glaucosporus TaxID=284044 RepID=A0ABN3HS67_9ACTN